ncbi:MAG TPA: hypothetical protein VF669_00225 [Tepidisphaeraceae bacterium]|jgi:hypothetical protein
MSANPAIPPPQAGPRSAEYIERRRNNRQTLEVIGILSEDVDAEFRGHLQVNVFDVCTGGVGFGSPVAFRPGTQYAMRIGTGPLHLKAKLQIVSSRPREDGMFDVGAKFV